MPARFIRRIIMAFQNHGRNAGYQHKPNGDVLRQDAAKGDGAGNGSASNGDGTSAKQAGNGAAGRSDAKPDGDGQRQANGDLQSIGAGMSDRKPYDPDADEKLNNGSRLHRAHATHYDDAPEHDKALHKLEARARQLVKPSRQGSGHTSTSVQQDTDSGKLRVGAYREPNPGDADETNTGSAVAMKAVAKKAVAKKVVAKKVVAKKAVAKKAVAKKAVAKKAVAKKAVAKKAVAKKAVAKKVVAKKVVAKKVVAKKAVAKKVGNKRVANAKG
jgi:hypothetical protein